jgi:UDP-N-acetylmuramoylalanine--D-glutamate ligase
LLNPASGLATLSGHTVLIVGVGREGVALARALRGLDQPPTLVALDGVDGESAAAFRAEWGSTIPLLVATGEHFSVPPLIAQASIAVVSPGVPLTSWLHRWVRNLGIMMTSGSALFVADHQETMVGVTGSKGKSTTATLIHQLLEASGEQVNLGGNMGIPLQSLGPAVRTVAELSSYQCHYMEASPDVVVLSALFPEHLDWHGSTEQYFDDKLSLVAGDPRVVIANGDDDILRTELTRRYPALPVEWVGLGQPWHLEPEGQHSWLCHGAQRLFNTRNSPLLGVHNHRNMLLALAGAHATGVLDVDVIESVLSTFFGLASRLEGIDDPSGLLFVNDSLATNPQAAVAGLQACSSPRMVWIVGGDDRGVDYQPLVDQVLLSRPRHILGLPGSGEKLVGLFRAGLETQGTLESVHLEVVAGMVEAVEKARGLAERGDYVLLSPGAPSFGHYRDYQHRADDFIAAIHATKPEDTL